MLRIAILGPLRAWHGDVPLGLPKRRDTARLWAYLLLHRGTPLARDGVARALWPQSEDARFDLRFHLHHLGRFLPPEAVGRPWLVVDRDRVAWNPAAPAEVDLDAFRAVTAASKAGPVDRAALEAVLSTCTGPLLAGMDEPWLEPVRAEVEAVYGEAMERLALAHADAGDAVAALAVAERLIERDPLREAPYRLAMRLHLAGGDPAMAAGVFERCRRVLATELDVEPEAETIALAETARTGALEAPAAAAVGGTAGPPTPAGMPPSFATAFVGVGRAEAVAALLEAHGVVTLVGAPGIGKSRLAAAAAATAADPSRAGGGSAAVAWVEVAGAGADGALPMRVARAYGRAADDPAACVGAVAEALSGRGGGLLVLDNADGAGAGGARLVETLVATVPGLRVLATSRSALGTRVETVWRVAPLAGPAGRDGWSPADPPEAVGLFLSRAAPHLRATLLTPSQIAAVTRVCAALDGVAEVIVRAAAALGAMGLDDLAAACDRGDLAPLDGARGVDGPRHARWRDAVAGSVDRLDPPDAALLVRLAVLDGGFDCAAAEAVCAGDVGGVDLSPDAVVDALDRLIARSLVQVDVNAPAGRRHRLLAPVRWALASRAGDAGGRCREPAATGV